MYDVKDFKLDVQESELLIHKYGILCFISSDGRRLYAQPICNEKEGLVIKILTKEQLKTLNVEESLRSSEKCVNGEEIFNITIEE